MGTWAAPSRQDCVLQCQEVVTASQGPQIRSCTCKPSPTSAEPLSLAGRDGISVCVGSWGGGRDGPPEDSTHAGVTGQSTSVGWPPAHVQGWGDAGARARRRSPPAQHLQPPQLPARAPSLPPCRVSTQGGRGGSRRLPGLPGAPEPLRCQSQQGRSSAAPCRQS